MIKSGTEWLYLYANGFNYRQIAAMYKVGKSTVCRHIHAYIRSLGIPQLKRGKVKRLFATADAGLVLAYHQCNRCGSSKIKLVYDEGVPEGFRCSRCAIEVSLLPGAFRLR